MVRADTEKMLGANMPREYVENFWKNATPKGTKANKSQVIEAMANLWLDLPDEAKQHYLVPISNKNPFENVVREVTRPFVNAIRAALTPAQRKIVDKNLKETKEKIGRK